MYSPGKAFVVYEIRRQVLPTAPSPTTTHFIACIVVSCVHWERELELIFDKVLLRFFLLKFFADVFCRAFFGEFDADLRVL